MIIQIMWPPDGCHPNKNTSMHWRDKGNARKWYKEACIVDTKRQTKEKITGDANIPVSIVFHPPRNSGDIDNMLAACKAGLDGMCLALGIDDKRLRPMTLDVGEKSPGGKVVIEI